MSRGERARNAVLLAAAIAVLGVRLYRSRLWFDFIDETVEIASGWLVSEGGTLYGTVFSHHMPLPVVAGQIVAAISPTDRIEHFRVAPFLAYLLAALAISRSPLLKARPGAGPIAAAIFLGAVALVAPNLWGHMLLADPLWGCAFVAGLALLVLPVLTGTAPTPAGAATGGACFVLAFAGSLVAVFPIALAGVLLVAAATDRGRRSIALGASVPALWGAATAVLALGLWLACFGEPANFFEEAFRFNSRIYSSFAYGGTPILASALGSWMSWLAGSPAALVHGDFNAWFLILFLAASAALGIAAWSERRPEGRWAKVLVVIEIAVSILLLASLRARGGGFHSTPFVLGLFAVLALMGARVERPGLAVAVTVLLSAPLVAFSLKDQPAWSSPSANGEETGPFGAAARYVAAHSREDETFGVFPFPPSLYVRARRRPATDAVHYFPWQQAWEASRPEAPDTCVQLRRARPRFVFLWPARVWDRFQWGEPGWGACIDQFVKRHYARVKPEEFDGLLWERRDDPASRDTMPR